MVREFQSVIGREARRQILEQAGRLPDVVVACVGGGSNAIGIFDALHRRSGRAADRRRGRRRADRARPARGAICRRQHRRAAGHAHVRPAGRGGQHRADAFDFGRARLRGGRPEHAWLARTGRTEYAYATDAEALDGVPGAGAARRDHSRARIGARRRLRDARWRGTLGPATVMLVNLSGRGDKDVQSVVEALR